MGAVVDDQANTQKRTSDEGMQFVQLPLLPEPMPIATDRDGMPTGGGSARRTRAATQGGGYQHIYTASGVSKKKHARDPRIDELRAARIGPVWIRVAENIGFEAFMVAWHTLRTFPGVGDDRHRVYVPCIEKYIESQINLLIRELVAQGYRPPQIRQELARRFGADVRTKRIAKKLRRGE